MSKAPRRRIVSTDESGFYVKFRLECGHLSQMYPYRFKDHKPYPKRRVCPGCRWQAETQPPANGGEEER